MADFAPSTRAVQQAKRDLLQHFVVLLEKDDDLHNENTEYYAFDAARDELAAEFERRSGRG